MKRRQSAPRARRTLSGAVAAVALLSAACGSENSTAAGSDSNDAVYELAAPTVDGGQLDFGSLEGKDSVLWFWAPW